MYLRISSSGSRKYLRLVKSYRDEHGKPRQRQIAQLERLDQLSERQIRGLIDSLKGLLRPREDELEEAEAA